MDNTEKLLRALIDALEFDIEVVNNQLAPPQNANDYVLTKRKKQVKARKANSKYSDEFENIWIERPQRAGSNGKPDACRAYNARLKEGDSDKEIMKGLLRYKRFLTASCTDKQYVMQMSTFLGPSRHYLEEWALPEVKKEKLKLPFRNEELEVFANNHGLSGPGRTDTYTEYRRKLQAEVELLND